jgi:hypothetical protein
LAAAVPLRPLPFALVVAVVVVVVAAVAGAGVPAYTKYTISFPKIQ